MKREIEIIDGAIQYGNLGQLALSDCILNIDNLVSIRGDVAFGYIVDALIKNGSLPPTI